MDWSWLILTAHIIYPEEVKKTKKTISIIEMVVAYFKASRTFLQKMK
jgi:hypothetical protein